VTAPFQLSIQDVQTPQAAADWFGRMLSDSASVGLKTSSWQSGAISKSVLVVAAYTMQFADAHSAAVAQGGFLDFASTGTVTYTDANGLQITEPVTPEGGPGWLDILVDSLYDEQRILEGFAGGLYALTNTTGATYAGFAAGTFHVSDPSNGQSYSTTVALSIPPSPVVGGTIATVTDYFGQIEIGTSAAHGLTTGAVVTVLGVAGVPSLAGATSWRVTVLDATHLVLDGSVSGGTYTTGGTLRTPTLTTVTADVVGTTGNSLDATGIPAANTVTQLVTSLVGVTGANVDPYFGTDRESNVALAARARLKLQSLSVGGPKGAYEFFALSAVKYAAKLNPPLKLGSAVTRVRKVVDLASGDVYTFCANPSGPSSPQDVAAVDAVQQAFAVPEAVTSTAAAATRKNATVASTVWLPAAYVTETTRKLFEAAVQSYFQTLQIGGVSDPQGSYQNIVPLEGIDGAIFDAAQFARIPIQNVATTINGIAQDLVLNVLVAFLDVEVAVLSPAVPSITLVGV
jgi:Baseplate J-like protein